MKFGIIHNKEIASKIDINDCYICNDLGGLKNYKDENYYKCVILINENDIKDGDIEKLIKELPKFNRVN